MKACFRPCLAAGAVIVLAACATTSDYETGINPSSDTKIQDDVRYMIAVEKATRTRGVEVIWVHPPQVRIDD